MSTDIWGIDNGYEDTLGSGIRLLPHTPGMTHLHHIPR